MRRRCRGSLATAPSAPVWPQAAAAAEFGLVLARNAACARAYSKASLRTSPAVWRSSAKKSVSSGSRTSCASTPRCPYQLITSLRYEMTACASGGVRRAAACAAAGLAAAAALAAAELRRYSPAPPHEAACDAVAGLCANAGALAIASAIANTAPRQSVEIEILHRGRMAISPDPDRRAKEKPYHRPNDSSIARTQPHPS